MLILEIAAGLWLLNAVVMTIVGWGERADHRAAWEAEFRRRDAIDCGLPIIGRTGRLGIRIVPAETVSAMDRTGAGRDDECPAAVFLQKARLKACRGIPHRISRESRLIDQFFTQRKHLP